MSVPFLVSHLSSTQGVYLQLLSSEATHKHLFEKEREKKTVRERLKQKTFIKSKFNIIIYYKVPNLNSHYFVAKFIDFSISENNFFYHVLS